MNPPAARVRIATRESRLAMVQTEMVSAALRAQSLNGVIDIHAHCDPDSTARSIDAIDLARLAHERGMRGLVLKNHYEPTASLAYIVRKLVPGLEVRADAVVVDRGEHVHVRELRRAGRTRPCPYPPSARPGWCRGACSG